MKKLVKIVLLLGCFPFLLLLSGCWDNHELDTLFIVTGIGLDKSEENNEDMNIALQIGKPHSESGGSEESGASSATIIMETKAKTMLEGLNELNRNSSRTMLLPHNQVLILGEDLAKEGIESRIDWFLRSQEARLEVLIMVAEGEAKEVLSAQLQQDQISGMYISRMMQDLSRISDNYEFRMFDFMSRLRDETSSPMAPIISVTGEDDKKGLKIDGLAVFKNDKMIGQLTADEMISYIWSMGSVKRCNITSEHEKGSAVFNIEKLNTKRKMEIKSDGNLKVVFEVDANVEIGELSGFDGLQGQELAATLSQVAEDSIQQRMQDTFKKAQSLNADIYEFGVSMKRRHPDEWEKMKENWDEVFSHIELDIQVKVKLPTTGKIVEPLEIGEGNDEN
ncbi:Ger(x)C family spore germination protein [Scatolibacter rhodanostii]|uniref:Ger(x)C family spore germination protein n=1 Tax=Scatolibacter rhodanostii TaxID=2014781 RepID=UPI000C082112|nr:Ger(x)C family spore germination protein [Scatolibacter rhodanostii]